MLCLKKNMHSYVIVTFFFTVESNTNVIVVASVSVGCAAVFFMVISAFLYR